jgi:D-alanyl-D-alanine carboxypeptidase
LDHKGGYVKIGFKIRSLTFVLGIAAGFLPAPPPAAAESKFAQLVMDADTGRVLHAVNSDVPAYPASLTKMMTLYLVFEAVDKGRLKLEDRVVVSARAASQAPSRLGLEAGASINVRNAVLAVVTKSANDIAVALAEHLAGSEQEFALAMTAKARALGMKNSTFRNASGLPHKGQLSTARDMAILARALLRQFPHHYHFFAAESFTYAGVTHKNHNQLLSRYDGADGIKTGYIRASGFNLVASAKRGDQRVIGVVFGDRSPAARNARMAELLDRGFERLAGTQVAAAPPPPKTMRKAKLTPAASRPVQVATNPPHKTPAADTLPGQWGIQVGAFHRVALAKDAATKATEIAATLLENGEVKIVPSASKRRKPLYRARIVGLTKQEAQRACAILRKKAMDCLALPDKDVEVATTS